MNEIPDYLVQQIRDSEAARIREKKKKCNGYRSEVEPRWWDSAANMLARRTAINEKKNL